MRKMGWLVVAVVLAQASNASAQVDTAWMRVSGIGDADQVRVDASGNVYICGYLQQPNWRYDFLLRKFSPEGDMLWERTYDGGIDDDYGSFLELDSAGGVYIAGWLNGDWPGADTDMGLVKYDTSGEFQWDYAYRGTNASRDILNDMAVEPDGDVFLVGTTRGMPRLFCITVSLSAAGEVRWERLFGEGTGTWTSGRSVILGADFVYVLGRIYGNALVIKYNHDGDTLWTRQLELGPDAESDAWHGVADPGGDLYIAGSLAIGDPSLPLVSDVFIANYSSAGEFDWFVRLDTLPFTEDDSKSLTLTSDGSLRLLTTGGRTSPNYTLVSDLWRIETDGSVAWNRAQEGRWAGASTSDSWGRTYVLYDGACGGFEVDCFASNGDLQWNECFPGSPPGSSLPSGLYVDEAGSIYITGAMSDKVATLKLVQPLPDLPTDILPASCPNIIRAGGIDLHFPGMRPSSSGVIPSNPKVPIAFLGAKSFDVSHIDPSTIQILGLSPVSHRLMDISRPIEPEYECECTTAGADGFDDLVLYFDREELIAAIGPTTDVEVHTLTLSGKTKTGVPLSGSDCVRVTNQPIRISPLTAAGEKAQAEFAAYPNPFNAATVISFALANESEARLDVYDVLGRRVETLVDEFLSAGEHHVSWDASGWASGVYFARLVTSDGAMTRKMVLVR